MSLEIMVTFADPETYAAYCNLVKVCWQELKDLGTKPDDFQPLADEFVKLVKKQAGVCTRDQARRWCSALRQAPFHHLLGTDWRDVLAKFTPRVRQCLREVRLWRLGEVMEWLDFVDENLTRETFTWGCECLRDVTDVDVPYQVACRAFDMLQRTAPETVLPVGSTVRSLDSLKMDEGKDVWNWPEYREALWAGLTRTAHNAAICDQDIRKCLRRILDSVVGNVAEFEKWVDIFLRLKKLKVTVQDPGDEEEMQ